MRDTLETGLIFRFFTCRFCGHKLRYGASRCGACHQPTQVLNRRWPLAVAIPLVAFLVLLLLS